MGQWDILEWLIKQRNTGNHSYLTMKQIEKQGEDKTEVARKVSRLYAHGYLDVKTEGFWNRSFRAKDKYVLKTTKANKYIGYIDKSSSVYTQAKRSAERTETTPHKGTLSKGN